MLAQAKHHERLQSQLGTSLTAGPWYNSSVVMSYQGHVAAVRLPLSGSDKRSDVTVKVSVVGIRGLTNE